MMSIYHKHHVSQLLAILGQGHSSNTWNVKGNHRWTLPAKKSKGNITTFWVYSRHSKDTYTINHVLLFNAKDSIKFKRDLSWSQYFMAVAHGYTTRKIMNMQWGGEETYRDIQCFAKFPSNAAGIATARQNQRICHQLITCFCRSWSS